MNDSMLAEQVRTLVDAVEPVGAAEIAERRVEATDRPRTSRRPSTRPSRRGVLVAVAVTLVIAVAGLGVVVVAHGGDGGRHVTVPPADDAPASTVVQPLPESCVVTMEAQEGCALAPALAERALGFAVRMPDGIPDGWVLWRQNLRYFTIDTPSELGPPGSRPLGEYDQIWEGPGVDMSQPVSGCAPKIYLFQSTTNIFDQNPPPNVGPVDLGDGQTAMGALTTERCAGAPDAPTAVTTFLYWNDRGVWINFTANGIDPDTALSIARSLDR